jgi:uncharacterized protein (TIGR01244 family)
MLTAWNPMDTQLTRVALTPLLFMITMVADGQESPDVIAVSVQQLHDDPAILSSHQYLSTDQPTMETLSAIAGAGFAAVVDLRTDTESRGIEESAAVRKLGMAYISIPVAGPEDMTYENAKLLDQVLSQLDGSVLLHCASGNRVGALIALRERLNGASVEQALGVGKQAGLTRSAGLVKSRLQEDWSG